MNPLRALDSEIARQALQFSAAPGNVNQRSSFKELFLELSDARFSSVSPSTGVVEIPGKLYGLVYAVNGSDDTGRLVVDFGSGALTIQPGAVIRAESSGVRITRPASSVVQGQAHLIFLLAPEVVYSENLGSGAGPGEQRGASVQAYNVTTNVPTLATDGVDVTGCDGVRAVIDAGASVSTITATLVWWFYDPAQGAWCETPLQEALAFTTARRYVGSNDYPLGARTGRVFAELRSLTHSGGSGNATVTVIAA
jgi:hypothetical protein